MKSLVANLLVVGGGVSITGGLYLLHPWAALVGGGAMAVASGVLLAMFGDKDGGR